MSNDTHHKAWAGNWHRGGANWLENRLNNTLAKSEPHDDRAMMRDAMTKLNQAADEIDRLYQIEKERDTLAREASYHQQELDDLLGRLRQAQAARDAHMAHSARISDILFMTFSAIENGEYSDIPYDEYRDAFNESPTTSLDQLIAEKQAEVFETAAGYLNNSHPVATELRSQAEDLRQQARGAQ